MASDRDQEAMAVFMAALDLSPPQRGSFVEERCGSDSELRAEVVLLLANDAAPDKLLDSPVPPERTTKSLRASPDELCERIGRYEIRGIIASGGMGTVYEAVQDNPRRAVALKVLRQGFAGSSSLRRFRHESEILGKLRHPNIAQVHDAGTFDHGDGAQPFFAMELIKGQPLVKYADAESLDTRQRIGLFVKVCDAVQHAHHKGVIHRDLKPDNILVDEHGEPKVLDFGVARITDSDIRATTLRTDIGELIGTVPYMSPEQVGGDPDELDTRSDVYSLGVVLYELLAGRLPHDLRDKKIPEAVRMIGEEDPIPLSSADRSFRGDLDTMVAKALEKDRNRRYQSAGDLAADARRYLTDEPIVARPASTFYQLRKFARRNRALVGGVLGMFVLLVVGVIGTSTGLMHAQREAAKSAAINAYLLRFFALMNPAEEFDELGDVAATGRALTLADLADRAAEELETAFPEWPDLRADMHFRLGRAYYGLGRTKRYGTHVRRAYELYEQTLGADDPKTLVALSWWAGVLDEGRSVEAEPLHREAVERLRRVCGEEDPRTLSASLWRANNLGNLHRYEESDALFTETLRTAEQALGREHRMTLTVVTYHAKVLHAMQRHARNEQQLRESLAISRRTRPEGDMITGKLARALGRCRRAQGHADQAVELYQEAYDSLHGEGVTVASVSLTVTFELASTLTAADRASEAEELLRKTVEECNRELGADDELTLWALVSLGEHLHRQGDLTGADEVLGKTYEHFARVPRDLDYWVAFATSALARVRIDLGWPDQAEILLRKTVELRRHVSAGDTRTIAAIILLARFLKDRDPEKLAESERLAREAVNLCRGTVGQDDRLSVTCMETLAAVLRMQGKHEEAEALSWR